MKKLLLVLLVLIFAGCSTTYELPTKKVYFKIVSEECFYWKDFRYSSNTFGDWTEWCGVLDIPKTVNPGSTFRLIIKAGKAKTDYRIYMQKNGILATGTIPSGKERKIEIEIN